MIFHASYCCIFFGILLHLAVSTDFEQDIDGTGEITFKPMVVTIYNSFAFPVSVYFDSAEGVYMVRS